MMDVLEIWIFHWYHVHAYSYFFDILTSDDDLWLTCQLTCQVLYFQRISNVLYSICFHILTSFRKYLQLDSPRFPKLADRYIGSDYHFWVRISSTIFISSTFSVLRPLYFDHFTSSSLLFISYWSSSTGRSTFLVEVKLLGRITEKVELMRTPISHMFQVSRGGQGCQGPRCFTFAGPVPYFLFSQVQ